MAKEGVPNLLDKADRRLRRKILGCDGADKTDHTQCNEDQTHADDVAGIPCFDTDINHRSHHKWNKQLERSFQQLEQRAKDGFFLILLQIDK